MSDQSPDQLPSPEHEEWLSVAPGQVYLAKEHVVGDSLERPVDDDAPISRFVIVDVSVVEDGNALFNAGMIEHDEHGEEMIQQIGTLDSRHIYEMTDEKWDVTRILDAYGRSPYLQPIVGTPDGRARYEEILQRELSKEPLRYKK